MEKKGIKNGSIEQINNDHETESAFQQEQKSGGTLK
ncbi:biofilm-forming protein [Bacillus glycinifermentans]|nr:biofilm-forming protein [Bacillus glycinifermentans]MEC3609179.1 biofilm-forming protein [Bacillus glycinifermentans]